MARVLVEFCERYDRERDGLWLALQDGHIEGVNVMDASHAEQDGAHLRWFIASDQLWGTGAGTALLTTAKVFCRSRHDEWVYLWTFEGLGAARHLYEKFGFRLAFQQRGTQWGAEVNEQRFECQGAQNAALAIATSLSHRLAQNGFPLLGVSTADVAEVNFVVFPGATTTRVYEGMQAFYCWPLFRKRANV